MAILKTKKNKCERVQKMKSLIKNNKVNFFPLSLRIESGLMKRFKMRAAKDEVSMTEILVDAIENYVNSQDRK
jgi:hypothetical protein